MALVKLKYSTIYNKIPDIPGKIPRYTVPCRTLFVTLLTKFFRSFFQSVMCAIAFWRFFGRFWRAKRQQSPIPDPKFSGSYTTMKSCLIDFQQIILLNICILKNFWRFGVCRPFLADLALLRLACFKNLKNWQKFWRTPLLPMKIQLYNFVQNHKSNRSYPNKPRYPQNPPKCQVEILISHFLPGANTEQL